MGDGRFRIYGGGLVLGIGLIGLMMLTKGLGERRLLCIRGFIRYVFLLSIVKVY
jgi:hypothetical protein